MVCQALHGVRAEDLAGPLRPEVVTGYVLTVTATEHQPVAVLFLLRCQASRSGPPCLCTSCTLCPDPGGFRGLCRPGRRAALNLTAHVAVPSTPDPDSCGGIQAAQGGKEAGHLQSTHAPPHPHLPWDRKHLIPAAVLQTRPIRGKEDTTSPTPRTAYSYSTVLGSRAHL